MAASSPLVSAYGGYAKGLLCCLLATVSFGLMFPVMTSALTRIDPFTFTSLRYVVAGAAFLMLLHYKEGRSALKLKGEPLLLAWALGSIGFAGFGAFVFLGQQMAGRDGALIVLGAGFVGVLSWNLGNRILSPLNGVLFMDVVPLTTFIVSALAGLIATPMQIAGGAMTCLALVLNNLVLRRRARGGWAGVSEIESPRKHPCDSGTNLVQQGQTMETSNRLPSLLNAASIASSLDE